MPGGTFRESHLATGSEDFEYGFLAPEFQKCKDIFATQEKKYEQKKKEKQEC